MIRSCLRAVGVAAVCCATAGAITIRLDYSYDASHFFGSGNPDGAAAGAQAKASLEAAASYLSDILQDDFLAIATPQPYYSSVFNGIATWQWDATFTHPAYGNTVTLTDQTIPAGEYVIYAGGRSIAGTTLGIGGPGGWGWSSGGNGGGFTTQEINAINSITADFSDLVESRGEASSEFANWGGSITFDSDSSSNWHWDRTTTVGRFENDFYSVALHELAHAVGFGTSNEWLGLVSGGRFRGNAAYAANGNSYPTVSGGHWTDGTQSSIYGSATSQEVAMDPTLTQGDRKYFTALDAAGLADIGWVLIETSQPGDFDEDGDVDGSDFLQWQSGASPGAADLALWQSNYGTSSFVATSNAVPEPVAVALAIAGSGLLLICQRRSR